MLVFAHSGYFHDLLDNFALGVIIINARGRIYATNAAAASLLGHPREAMLSDPDTVRDIFQRTDAPRALRRHIWSAMRHAAPQPPLRLRYQHPLGRIRHFSLTSSHLVENEKVFGIMLQITDVTEIITLHERERHILKEKYRAEHERVESLAKLSSAVAHQLRNPAASIGGLAGLMLRKCAPDDPRRPHLQAVVDQSRRLEAIVAAVADLTAPIAPRPEPVPLRELVRERIARLQAARAETGRRLIWVLEGDDPWPRLDPALLGRVLDEVLENAEEASPDGGRVRVDISRESGEAQPPGRIRIAVKDRGRGIPPEIAPYLFDPFFTTKAVGVGMGLCLAKRLLEAMDGEIRLKNRPGGGTTAVIRIPGGDVRPG